MAQRATRIYKVINAEALLGPGGIYRFRGAASPAGALGTVPVGGRRERVVILGYTVVDERHGRAQAAEFVDVYL